MDFRKAHKGLTKQQKSALYQAYKEDDVEKYTEVISTTGLEPVSTVMEHMAGSDTVVEAGDNEISEPPVVETKKVEEVEEVEEVKVGGTDLSLLEMIKHYNRASKRLITWGPSMAESEKAKANIILKKYAKKTLNHINPKYKVTDTDAWEKWEGQEGYCILMNQTRGFAFECSRVWWNHHYSGARMVHTHTFTERGRLDTLRNKFIRQKRYIHRAPLPDVEIMLPRTARDFHKPE